MNWCVTPLCRVLVGIGKRVTDLLLNYIKIIISCFQNDLDKLIATFNVAILSGECVRNYKSYKWNYLIKYSNHFIKINQVNLGLDSQLVNYQSGRWRRHCQVVYNNTGGAAPVRHSHSRPRLVSPHQPGDLLSTYKFRWSTKPSSLSKRTLLNNIQLSILKE